MQLSSVVSISTESVKRNQSGGRGNRLISSLYHVDGRSLGSVAWAACRALLRDDAIGQAPAFDRRIVEAMDHRVVLRCRVRRRQGPPGLPYATRDARLPNLAALRCEIGR